MGIGFLTANIVVDWIGGAICYIFYALWLFIAGFVNLFESAFRILAGIEPVKGSVGGASAEKLGVGTPTTTGNAAASADAKSMDLVTRIIESSVVRGLFQNMIIAAVALIMFFTIIQIIREQYKNKDGGNPYLIVFRMFKGMITMLFITSVVIVGLQVSGIIFRGLDALTGGGEGTGTSGTIFGAMSHNANKLRFSDATDEAVATGKAGAAPAAANLDEEYDEECNARSYSSIPKNISRTAYGELPYWTGEPSDDWQLFKSWVKFENAFKPTGLTGFNYLPFIDGGDAFYLDANFAWGKPTDGRPRKNPTRDAYYLTNPNNVEANHSSLRSYMNSNFADEDNDYANIKDIPGAPDNILNSSNFIFNMPFFKAPHYGTHDLNSSKQFLSGLASYLAWQALFEGLHQMQKYIGSLDDFNFTFNIPFIGDVDLVGWTGLNAHLTLNEILTHNGKMRGLWFWLLNMLMIDQKYDVQVKNWGVEEDPFGNWLGKLLGVDVCLNKKAYILAGKETLNSLYEPLRLAADTAASTEYKAKAPFAGNLFAGVTCYEANVSDAGQCVGCYGGKVGFDSLMSSYLPTVFQFIGTLPFLGGAVATIINELVEGLVELFDVLFGGVQYFNLRYTVPANSQLANMLDKTMIGNFLTQGTTTPIWEWGGAGSFSAADGDGADAVLSRMYQMDETSTESAPVLKRTAADGTVSRLPVQMDEFGGFDDDTLAALGLVKRTAAEIATYNFDAEGINVDELYTIGDSRSGIARVDSPQKTINKAKQQGVQFHKGKTLEEVAGEIDEKMCKRRDLSTVVQFYTQKDDKIEPVDLSTVSKKMTENGRGFWSYVGMIASFRWIGEAGRFTPENIAFDFEKSAEAGYWSGATGMSRSGLIAQAKRAGFIVGEMSYEDIDTVGEYYHFHRMDIIVGFALIFIVFGVFLSFTFGLIQRILELVILYILSPLTLAFYPIDNGTQFTSTFAQPFYKTVISIYAIILSMNLFFAVLPVFRSIRVFEPSKVIENIVMNAVILLCCLSMLPKVRSTITNMLGAGSVDEKSLGSVWKDSVLNKMAKPIGKGAKFLGSTGLQAANRFAMGRGGAEEAYKNDWMNKNPNGGEEGFKKYMEEKKAKKLEEFKKGRKGAEMSKLEAAAKGGDKAAQAKLDKLNNKAEKSAVGKINKEIAKSPAAKKQNSFKKALGKSLFDAETGTLAQKGPLAWFNKTLSANARLEQQKKLQESDLRQTRMKAERMAQAGMASEHLGKRADNLAKLANAGGITVDDGKGGQRAVTAADFVGNPGLMKKVEADLGIKGKNANASVEAKADELARKFAADSKGGGAEAFKEIDAQLKSGAITQVQHADKQRALRAALTSYAASGNEKDFLQSYRTQTGSDEAQARKVLSSMHSQSDLIKKQAMGNDINGLRNTMGSSMNEQTFNKHIEQLSQSSTQIGLQSQFQKAVGEWNMISRRWDDAGHSDNDKKKIVDLYSNWKGGNAKEFEAKITGADMSNVKIAGKEFTASIDSAGVKSYTNSSGQTFTTEQITTFARTQSGLEYDAAVKKTHAEDFDLLDRNSKRKQVIDGAFNCEFAIEQKKASDGDIGNLSEAIKKAFCSSDMTKGIVSGEVNFTQVRTVLEAVQSGATIDQLASDNKNAFLKDDQGNIRQKDRTLFEELAKVGNRESASALISFISRGGDADGPMGGQTFMHAHNTVGAMIRGTMNEWLQEVAQQLAGRADQQQTQALSDMRNLEGSVKTAMAAMTKQMGNCGVDLTELQNIIKADEGGVSANNNAKFDAAIASFTQRIEEMAAQPGADQDIITRMYDQLKSVTAYADARGGYARADRELDDAKEFYSFVDKEYKKFRNLMLQHENKG
jgi:hypothetical protein